MGTNQHVMRGLPLKMCKRRQNIEKTKLKTTIFELHIFEFGAEVYY